MIRTCITVISCIMLFSSISSADIPYMINYQGKVTDSGGTPVSDGTYSMRFGIYDQLLGGSPEWDSGDQNVDVTDGIFSVMLGGVGQPTLDLEFDTDYWLQVGFEGIIQSPRRRIASVGYSYMAQMASGLVPGTEIIGDISTEWATILTVNNTAASGITHACRFECAASGARTIYSRATSYTGSSYAIHAESNSSEGRGVFAQALSTEGETHGVYGSCRSPLGAGVLGIAVAETGTNNGVKGTSYSYTGTGVYGTASDTDGPNFGVKGRTLSLLGTGVYGYATSDIGGTVGVHGKVESSGGKGVLGEANSDSGLTYGVFGESISTSGIGVLGQNYTTEGTTYGVYGRSDSPSGVAVYGYNAAESGSTEGVYGIVESSEGRAVVGWAQSTTGDARGVYGRSDAQSGFGVYGYSNQTTGISVGVYGESESSLGDGVTGYCPNVGVMGVTSIPTTGLGVYYSGGLGGSGSKSCIVKTSQGPTYMYCQESPENWFEDFGEGQLIDGRCHIELDPLFLETVSIDDQHPMKVFVELGDECNGVYVRRRTTGFEVIELHNGSSDASFCYRIVAKRKGFEDKRLDYCKAAESDPYLYPELRKEFEQRHREDRARTEQKHSRMLKRTAEIKSTDQRFRELRNQG